MKNSFKYVIAGIITVLFFVFVGQLFWLKGLYNSIEEEVTRNVISCMETAEAQELFFRIESLDKKGTSGSSIEISGSISDKKEDNALTQKTIQIGDSVNLVKRPIERPDSATLYSTVQYLMLQFKSAVHQSLDHIAPINNYRYDSLVNVNFENKKILAKVHYSEVVHLNTDSVLGSSKDSLATYKHAQSFDYVFDTNNQLAYRIYTTPLTKTILTRMSGILITTGLIILILIIAFRYLILTVFRQKTLEEMKDDFTNNMTHELKTPIAVAYSATDALLNFNKAEDKAIREKYLLISKEQLLKLSGLVEQILSVSTTRNKTLVLNCEEFLLKELVEAKQQVVVTTHSPLFLNYLDDDLARDSVQYFYKTPEGFTRCRKFFSLPSTSKKLGTLGPGEVIADTNLYKLNEEIEQLDRNGKKEN